jgi:hypothetical protein
VQIGRAYWLELRTRVRARLHEGSVLGHSRDSPADWILRAIIALYPTSDLQAAPDSKHATLVTVVLQRTDFRFEKSNVRNAPGKIRSNLAGYEVFTTGCSSINERAQSRHSSAVTLRCWWTHESMPWHQRVWVTLPNLLSNGQIGLTELARGEVREPMNRPHGRV